jgi:DNA-binding CsgD family transcriptional regulator
LARDPIERGPSGDDWAQWLASDSRPRVIVTPSREILWQNEAARRLLHPPQPVFVRNGSLCLEDARNAKELENCLNEVGGEPCRLPIFGRDGETCLLVNAHSSEAGGQRQLFLAFCLALQPFSIRESGMVEWFGLTRAEAQIVEAICQLETPSATAERLGLSVHTVRSHLRNIFNKLSVHSQQQLVRMAIAFAGL